MPGSIKRRGRSLAPVSYYLEEYWPIDYQVLGTADWLAGAFEENALSDDQKILISEASDLAPYKEWLDLQPYHGGDTETDGKDPRLDSCKVLLLQLGTHDRVLAIEPQLIPEFKQHLESTRFLHLFQNAVYDFKALLTKHRVHINRMYDTMLAEQLLTSGLQGKGVGLIDIVRRYPPHRIISKEIRKQFVQHGGRFTRQQLYYAVRDVVLLFPVMEAQAIALKRLRMEEVAKTEFDVIPVTAMMEIGGVFIDDRVLVLALEYYTARRRQLEADILNIYNQELKDQGRSTRFLFDGFVDSFDIQSNTQKLAALQDLGMNINDTRRDTLELMNHPIAPLLVEYSEVMKVITTYGESLRKRVDPVTGLLYPEFNQLGSGDVEGRQGKAKKGTISTGRFSSDFQQLPRPEKRYSEVTGEDLHQVYQLFGEEIAKLTNPKKEEEPVYV